MDIENLTPEQLEQVATLAFGSNKPLHFGVSIGLTALTKSAESC